MRALLKLCCGVGALALASCASTDVAPIETGASPDVTTDEAGLWQQMDKYEQSLRASALLERDPALNAYVRGIVCDITGTDYCEDLRIYVVNRPFFNATMAPNGLMEVWTGLLLRAENEAQLAFVLGHEFTHYKNRHSLKNWRKAKNAANASLLVSIGAAAAGAGGASELGSLLALSALYGYGRDLEREADMEGFAYVTAAGYDGSQAAVLWQNLVAEVQASQSKRKKRRFARSSIFSSHPLTKERIATLQGLAADLSPGKRNEQDYIGATAPFLAQWLDDDLVRRDFGENLFLINKLIERGDMLGTLFYAKAEALRLRRGEGDMVKAEAAYLKATKFSDAPAKAWRALGDALRRKGDTSGAITAYQIYLELNPAAVDRLVVENFIKTHALEG